MDEGSEEEEDVLFTLIDDLPRSRRPNPSAEVEDREREERERKRKGKAIVDPSKKKPSQAPTTLVIQEGQRSAEQDEEEDEALRMERRTKLRNDGARSASKQRLEMARIQFEKIRIRLDSELLGRMVTFTDPQTTKECAARVEPGKKARSGRRLDQLALEDLEGIEEFMQYITGIGFDWLLDLHTLRMPIELAQEFFIFFQFKFTTDVGAESISFRIFTREMRMSIREWSVRLGLYTADQEAEWFGRDIGAPKEVP